MEDTPLGSSAFDEALGLTERTRLDDLLMSSSGNDDCVVEGQYYDLIVGFSIQPTLDGVRVFQILNKEFNVVEQEGHLEMTARYQHNHYEELKARFQTEGLEGILGLPEGPK